VAERFTIVYTREAADDIGNLRAFDRQKAIQGIEQYLSHQPRRVSRSRIKVMIQPFWSEYRLRLDEIRVYYDVDDINRRVNILRVLIKGTDPTPTVSP
jgi:mRNA-degrading endonuclease RelE of RelBE toxin-antitoxin system